MSGEKKAEKPAATADVNERGIFQLPRPTWVADKDVTECVECKAEFTTFNRKVREPRASRRPDARRI